MFSTSKNSSDKASLFSVKDCPSSIVLCKDFVINDKYLIIFFELLSRYQNKQATIDAFKQLVEQYNNYTILLNEMLLGGVYQFYHQNFYFLQGKYLQYPLL